MPKINLDNSIIQVNPPFILLIVATYNCAPTLTRCIESFIDQTYPHKKLVIIDGGSTDGTVDIIRRYESHITHWQSEPDKGIYDAWNKALTCGVEADWIQFMGADDYYYNPSTLDLTANILVNLSNPAMLVYGQTTLEYPNGTLKLIGDEYDRDSVLKKGVMPSGQVSMFYNRSIFSKYGKFDDNFLIAGDLEHFLRITQHIEPTFFNNVVTVHRVGGISSNYKYAYIRFLERDLALSKNGYKLTRNIFYYYVKMVRWVKAKLCTVANAELYERIKFI